MRTLKTLSIEERAQLNLTLAACMRMTTKAFLRRLNLETRIKQSRAKRKIKLDTILPQE